MMLRPLRSALRPSVLAALVLATGIGVAQFPAAVQAQAGAASSAQGGPALGKAEASAAAERILEAIKNRDANTRYSQFSEELKQTSSPTMVDNTLKTQPALISWSIQRITPGLRNTTVEVTLNTAAGQKDLFMVLNRQGQLVGQLYDASKQPSTKVALAFVKALSNGQFISARSYLSLDMQKELPPIALQAKWLNLQRETGNFVKVDKAVEAEQTKDGKLVLVNTEFNRLTDTLFVILNNKNQIIGVDFPNDPAKPQKVQR
jgi:hypothetical protein